MLENLLLLFFFPSTQNTADLNLYMQNDYRQKKVVIRPSQAKTLRAVKDWANETI